MSRAERIAGAVAIVVLALVGCLAFPPTGEAGATASAYLSRLAYLAVGCVAGFGVGYAIRHFITGQSPNSISPPFFAALGGSVLFRQEIGRQGYGNDMMSPMSLTLLAVAVGVYLVVTMMLTKNEPPAGSGAA